MSTSVTSYKVSRPSGRVSSDNSDVDGPYVARHGHVVTPNGIVMVHSTDYNNPHTKLRYRTTHMSFVFEGREWSYFVKGVALSPRGLVTAADRFAREVVDGLWD